MKPKNYQNTPETQKITKILSKPKNDKNTPQTPKKTKIPPKLKKYLCGPILPWAPTV